MQKNTRSLLIRKITLSALFLALAVVAKSVTSIPISIFGANGIRISLGGIFSAFPAFLFGPLYGGSVSAMLDVIGWAVKPDGPYNPLFTITAFAGGFIKGFLWLVLSKYNTAKVRAVTLALLVVLGVSSSYLHYSLISDGITDRFISATEQVATGPQILRLEQEGKLSAVSSKIIELAKYNKDTVTLSSVDENVQTVVIPSTVTVGGVECSLNAIGAGAFAVSEAEAIYIPGHIKKDKIAADAFDGPRQAEFFVQEGSGAQEFLQERELPYTVYPAQTASLAVPEDTLSAEGMRFTKTDTFRKNLAGYINFVTVGFELTAALGILILLLGMLLSYFRKKKQKAESYYTRILLSITVAGLAVTTINTVILQKIVIPAWGSREFMILWIPRAAEEIIVCIAQAIVISLLYNVYRTRILQKNSFTT